MNINIYCDESCHLLNDGYNIAVLGGMSLEQNKIRELNKKIREIKIKHKIYKYAELKWVKVSINKIDMYKELIDLFFENKDIYYRAVVVRNKDKINLDFFGFTYDDWFYRVYYLVLKEMLDINYKYNIYLDTKDNKNYTRIVKLKDVLSRTLYDFCESTIINIQSLRSDQVEIMGLVDILNGAVSYKNRKLSSSRGKLELIKYIESKIENRSLEVSSSKFEKKCNIFIWEPKNV